MSDDFKQGELEALGKASARLRVEQDRWTAGRADAKTGLEVATDIVDRMIHERGGRKPDA